MDWWNNKIGREIAKEVYKQTKGLNVTNKQIEDLYAQKIVERMRNKNLITSPKDQRAQTIPQKIKKLLIILQVRQHRLTTFTPVK